jgi:hypothetical protein
MLHLRRFMSQHICTLFFPTLTYSLLADKKQGRSNGLCIATIGWSRFALSPMGMRHKLPCEGKAYLQGIYAQSFYFILLLYIGE